MHVGFWSVIYANYHPNRSRSKISKLQEDVVSIVFSGLGVAQVFLPRRYLFSGHTVGEEISSLGLR